MQTNTKPQNGGDDDYGGEERKREIHIKKNQLCMSNTERKDIKVEWLVISYISKNNHINKAREDAILTLSLLFSLYLSLSTLVILKPQVVVFIVVLLLLFSSSTLLYIC
jgi:hypothetical protein